MILLTALFLIFFKASFDGLAIRGHKTLAGVINAIYTAIISLIVFAWVMGIVLFGYGYSFAFIIAGFLLLRFALFDVILNLCAGMPIFYIGKTKLWDKAWKKFFKWTNFPPDHFLGMTKILCAILGVTWLLTK